MKIRMIVAAAVAATAAVIGSTTAVQAATTVQAAHQPAKHLPSTVKAWSAAWSGTDPAALGKLFTANGTYTDHAIGATMTGREQIAGWKARTDSMIENVHVTVRAAWRDGGHHITIRGVYAGHIKGAPKPFAVPSVTLLDTDGRRITANQDFYNLADVLAQSGLPADWTPSAG
ncbi:nuclear transport factor 2 family protein [Microtetraspora malaysiensis]|uniref:nuclear transport factor 2 family protein n=1 Tax=Microtetraspora malaysiensis TaxID=161358 RepID=UPI0008345CD7|nr:nuclear transport factor 2 family protein [Microtetraspora malaysiensis]